MKPMTDEELLAIRERRRTAMPDWGAGSGDYRNSIELLQEDVEVLLDEVERLKECLGGQKTVRDAIIDAYEKTIRAACEEKGESPDGLIHQARDMAGLIGHEKWCEIKQLKAEKEETAKALKRAWESLLKMAPIYPLEDNDNFAALASIIQHEVLKHDDSAAKEPEE